MKPIRGGGKGDLGFGGAVGTTRLWTAGGPSRAGGAIDFGTSGKIRARVLIN